MAAVEGKYRGILRVDPGHPWHFIWERSGEHCFVNGTTAFLLMGWDSEQMIRDCIDRLRGFKVNRIVYCSMVARIISGPSRSALAMDFARI